MADRNRWRVLAIPGVVFVVALMFFVTGALQSPLGSDRLETRRAYTSEHLSLQRAGFRAREYWKLYPDVRADPFFGEGGAQGIFGARVHYERHGREEGRTWRK